MKKVRATIQTISSEEIRAYRDAAKNNQSKQDARLYPDKTTHEIVLKGARAMKRDNFKVATETTREF